MAIAVMVWFDGQLCVLQQLVMSFTHHYSRLLQQCLEVAAAEHGVGVFRGLLLPYHGDLPHPVQQLGFISLKG